MFRILIQTFRRVETHMLYLTLFMVKNNCCRAIQVMQEKEQIDILMYLLKLLNSSINRLEGACLTLFH
jgi:hypothetical protein